MLYKPPNISRMPAPIKAIKLVSCVFRSLYLISYRSMLGFLCDRRKFVLQHSKESQFLGFIFLSLTLEWYFLTKNCSNHLKTLTFVSSVFLTFLISSCVMVGIVVFAVSANRFVLCIVV